MGLIWEGAAFCKQTRENLSVKTRAAMRKLERFDYLLSACSAPISRRLMEALNESELPELRVEAAVRVLRGEQRAGRDSDYVRACLASLQYCDERDLAE